MKKSLLLGLILTMLLVGCSKNSVNSMDELIDTAKEQFAQDDVVGMVTEALSSEEEVEEVLTKVDESSSEPEQSKSELKPYEQLALDYFTVFHNNINVDEKKQYLEEHMHPDVKQVFGLGASTVVDEDKRFADPQFISSADYNADGVVDGKVVLFASGDKEAIILINDGKIGWVFYSTDSDKTGFDSLKQLIK